MRRTDTLDYKLRLVRDWRYSPNGQVMVEKARGDYRVPEDMSEKDAVRAIRQGAGRRLDVVKRAPADKVLHAAPENK